MEQKIDINSVMTREIYRDKMELHEDKSIFILKLLYGLEMAVANFHHEETDHEKSYNYIPFSHIQFYRDLKSVIDNNKMNAEKISFLDVGCGLGINLAIAKEWCNVGSVTGLEINKNYAEIAKESLQALYHNAAIICGDAMKFNDYKSYDIIYTWHPVKYSDYEKLKTKIVKDMKKGAHFMIAHLARPCSVFAK